MILENVVRLKNIDDTYKGLIKSISSIKYAYGDGDDAGASEKLTWSLIEKTGTTEDVGWTSASDSMRNLFLSFGLDRKDTLEYVSFIESFDKFNAKRMLIATIPQSGCGSYIDGSSVRLNVPIGTGTSEFTTFYGSTYAGYMDQTNGLNVCSEYQMELGSATCYLFADTNNTKSTGELPSGTYNDGFYFPYTGSVGGLPNPNSGITSWDVENDSSAYTWATAEVKLSPHLRAVNNSASIGDEKFDVPYGIAFLEKGIFVIFDTYYNNRADFVGATDMGSTASLVWTGSTAPFQALAYSAGTLENNINTNNRDNVVFTGTNAYESAKLVYRTVDVDYKMLYFCYASMGEFNRTDNPTYNHRKAFYLKDDAQSIYITEIGLYDNDEQLVAYAKLSEPVEKNKLETLSFKVELNL